MEEMRLLKRHVTKDGKDYLDVFLCWYYNKKFYEVRVKTTFPKDFNKLLAQAIAVPEGEELEKYF